MKAYKLFKIRKNGTIGPLFINARMVLEIGVPYDAENHPTKGFAVRPGWHCCATPSAPHLSKKGRAWFEVEIEQVTEHHRPESQGGLWYTAGRLTVIKALEQ